MEKKRPLRIVFMGTPDFAVPSLKMLLSKPEDYQVVAVYTQPDRPAGRGQKLSKPPIKIVAEENGIPVFQPESINSEDEKRRLADFMSDVAVIVAYAQFLGNAVLNIPRLGCVNVHSSLLPKYRGAAPIQYAVWKGETETGVTIMRLVKKMDAGPIITQKSMPIPKHINASELHDQLAILGSNALIEGLALIQDRSFKEIEQNHDLATYAHIIKKEDGQIDWTKSGEDIVNQVRALSSWPGTFSFSSQGILKIHHVRFIKGDDFPSDKNARPGTVKLMSGGLFVRCGDGWIELLKVQPEGRKVMSTVDYLNGIRNNPIQFTGENKK